MLGSIYVLEGKVITIMSVSGPCAWVSTVPSPVTTHSSAIANSWAAVSWNNEQNLTKSKAELPALSGVGATTSERNRASPVDMQSAASKGENTYHTQSTTDSSHPTSFSARNVHLSGKGGQKSNDHGDTLSTLKLESLNAQFQEMRQSRTNKGIASNVKSGNLEETHEDEKDPSETNAVSSDDDGASSSVADEKKSSLEARIDKKKMKRFR